MTSERQDAERERASWLADCLERGASVNLYHVDEHVRKRLADHLRALTSAPDGGVGTPRQQALRIAERVVDEYGRQTDHVLDINVLVEALSAAGLLRRLAARAEGEPDAWTSPHEIECIRDGVSASIIPERADDEPAFTVPVYFGHPSDPEPGEEAVREAYESGYSRGHSDTVDGVVTDPDDAADDYIEHEWSPSDESGETERESASVIYREGPPTREDYDEAIEALSAARDALGKPVQVCPVCHDGGHTAEQCHHNPLVMARRGVRVERAAYWRCFHCHAVFAIDEEDEAREHFGDHEHEPAACATDDPPGDGEVGEPWQELDFARNMLDKEEPDKAKRAIIRAADGIATLRARLEHVRNARESDGRTIARYAKACADLREQRDKLRRRLTEAKRLIRNFQDACACGYGCPCDDADSWFAETDHKHESIDPTSTG